MRFPEGQRDGQRYSDGHGDRARAGARLLAPLFLFLLSLSLACGGRPMRGDSGIRPFAFDLWDVHCPSGLRVIVERAPGSRVAGVTSVVRTGSQDDPPGREGLAHLVEHLTYRAERDGQSLATRMGALGGTGNASTSSDDTMYYTFTANEDLAALLALEGARLAAPLDGVTDEAFAVEREVVRSELRERNETGANGRALSLIDQALFPATHPYSRPVGGTHQSLSSLTLDDARAFTAARYRPEMMTVLIVGDVDLAGAEALVKSALPPALYGDPAHARPVVVARSPAPPPPPAPRDATPLRPNPAAVESPELWIAWSVPGGYGPQSFIATMWATLVEWGFDAGTLDDPDIANVSFFALRRELATELVCRVRLVAGTHPEDSAKVVLKELPWVGGEDAFLESQFRQLKLSAMRYLALAGENVETRSRERARYAAFTGNLGFYGAAMDTVRSINADGARAFAERYLAPERARTIWLQPQAADAVAERAPPPSEKASAPERSSRGSSQVSSQGPLVVPAAPPPGEAAARARLGEVRTVTLPNGMPLIAVRRRGAPVITAAIGFHGGRAIVKPGAGLAAEAGLEPAAEESPGEYGIGMRFSVYRDIAIQTGSAGAGNLPRLLDMMTFWLKGYDVEWPSDKIQTKVLPLWRKREASPTWQADRGFWNALYGAHPYGVVSTADAIAALSHDDVASWLGKTLAPHNAALVVVGDIDPAEVEAAARASIGTWWEAGEAAAPPPIATPQPWPAALARTALPGLTEPVVTHRPGSSQATLRLGCLLPPVKGTGDQAVDDVAAETLRVRLDDRLRWRLGATYGVQAAAKILRGGTNEIQLDMTVDNAQLTEALETIGWTFTRGPVENDGTSAFDRARGGIIANQRVADSAAGLATELLVRWNLGWSPASLDDFPRQVASTTQAEVDTVVDACARSLVLSIAGDKAIVQRALHR